MCGIGGIFLRQEAIPSEVSLRTMIEVMHSRGPDDSGVYTGAHIGLVHTRLSIRDLSSSAKCPMHSSSSEASIVFNGEIYNWRELRHSLERCGHCFHTQSDTEVLLYGYLEWGTAIFERARGMFALAIWDARSRSLVLARDRAGEKPLFYAENEGGLRFGSSARLFEDPDQIAKVSPVAVGCYLSHSFIPAPRTIYRGVLALPPAHYLTVSVGGKSELHRYWDFPKSAPKRQPARVCERIIERALDDSVARCLDADVPVGLFLSGGVDSSLVAAIANRHRRGLPAFTLGFAETAYSEIPSAERVAKHLGLDHHVAHLTPENVVSWLPYLVRQYGQPFGDSSALPTYALARLARHHVTVCLCGDGGDESFAGYWRAQSTVYAARYGQLVPRWIREQLVTRAARLIGSAGHRLSAMNDLSLQPIGKAYSNSQSWFNRMHDIAGPALREVLSLDLGAFRTGTAGHGLEYSPLQQILYDDFVTQLPDAYLTKVDVASMAASLEVRAPFLDQPLIEAAWTMPDGVKLHWGQRKWILKRIAAKLVPPEVVFRRKMGFGMPVAPWFRGVLGEYFEFLMRDSVATELGWIREATVVKTLDEHRRGQDHSTRLWLVLWLELWFRQRAHGPCNDPATCL